MTAEVPKMALESDPLLHGIHALAAIHLVYGAWDRSDARERHALMEIHQRYLVMAIREHRDRWWPRCANAPTTPPWFPICCASSSPRKPVLPAHRLACADV